MGGKTQTTNQTSTNTPAGLEQLRDIYNRVSQVASTPYSPYTGQMTAGLTDTQNQGIAGITAAQGAASPYFDQAADYARTGAAPISAADIQRYQSPYTQQVIDATKANFRQDNAIGQQQVIGNAAAKGALGGDRVGVAQAELARQQGLAQNPVIAGLENQGYTQALGAAQQDRAATAQGAYTFGALAPSVQNAKISGAQAQIGAGGLQQGTNQAGLTAAYNQYLQAQAFPYQQAGFLASAGLPAAAGMGGTTTGQTTSPGPNPWVQAAGLGLSAAAAFSDERIKKNKRQIGKTFDGQPIFSFTYGDNPQTHLGLMAQEVEKTHPEAVGEVGGIKTVDYAMATDDAARKQKFADGGPVNFMDVQGYVPRFGGVQSASPYGSAPALPALPQRQADQGISPAQMAAGMKGLKGMMPDNSNYDAAMAQTGPTFAGDGIGAMGGVSFPIFNRGGRVGRFSRGGSVNRADHFAHTVNMIRQTLRGGGVVNGPGGYAAGGDVVDLSPAEYVRQGFGDTQSAIDSGAFDPQGQNAPGPMAFADPQQATVPVPRPRPDDAPSGPMALPPIMTAGMGEDPDALPDDASAFTRPRRSPYALPADGAPMATDSEKPPGGDPSRKMGGLNLFNLSDDARMAIMSAGLGVAASKSPFALSAIGEGGQQGIKTYGDRLNHRQQVEAQARQMAQQASQFAQNLGLHRDQLEETKRRGDTADRRADILDKRAEEAARRAQVPPGYRQAADGALEPIPGGPQDPANIKAAADAKRGTAGLLDDDTLSDMAGQYLSGDKSVMQNLGRGAQGAENIVKLRAEISRQAREAGLTPNQVATKMADFAGRTAAMRSLGTRGVNVEYAANTANKAIDLAEEAYSKLPRTQFVPFNKLRQLYDTNTSSPEQAAAYTATNTLVNEYARVASGGSNTATEGMRQHARDMLNTAQGPEAFNATLKMMRREIQTAKSAYNETRKEFLSDSHARDEKTDLPPAAAAAPKVGDRKQFKQGWGVWDGKQYVPEKP